MSPQTLGNLLGARLRERREAVGWSQAELAEAVGVTPNYVGVIERGEKLPTLETVEAVSRALGVSVGTLLADDAPDDPWARQAVALARAVPASHRDMTLAILRAIVAETRPSHGGSPKPYEPAPNRPFALSDKRRPGRKP
jgi:transcriptional regulator with XRE-family HTH domain